MKLQQDQLLNLVPAAQQGDMDALGVLLESCYSDIYSFALSTVKEHDLAENITQESCIEVMNTIANLHEPSAFNAWLRRITYHQCTRYFKKRKDVLVDENEDGETIFDTLQDDDIESLPEEVAERKDLQEIIKDMVDSLPEEQRAALMMYYFDGLSVKEIAEVQGVSEGTVKSRLNYGRKALMASVEYYERKNNIKLHSFSFFPLFALLFGGNTIMSMPTGFISTCIGKAAAGAAGEAVASAVGETAASATGEVLASVAGNATASTAGAVAKEAAVAVTKQVAKKAATAVGVKIAAGLITAGIITTATVAIVNPNDIVGTVAEAVFGIEKKTEVEKTLEKFEKAYNNKDMYALIECYPPQYQADFKFAMTFMYGTSFLFGSEDDFLGDIFSETEGNIEIEVLNEQYNETGDLVVVTVSAFDGTTTEVEDLELIKINGKWYFNIEINW